MEPAGNPWTALVGHASPTAATPRVDARVQPGEPGTLVFRYVLRDGISRVRIPPSTIAERADGLWKHTCFEAFMMAPDAGGYYEFNFAPSHQWAAYHFDTYRDGMSVVHLAAPPHISVRRYDDRLEVDAAVQFHDLIALRAAPRLRLGLSAVVEDENGNLGYWALKHAPGKPDFHAPDGFVLELAM
jgi:hypothetical protein